MVLEQQGKESGTDPPPPPQPPFPPPPALTGPADLTMGGETSLEFPSGPLELHVRPAVCFLKAQTQGVFPAGTVNLGIFQVLSMEEMNNDLMPLCLAFDRREFEFSSF